MEDKRKSIYQDFIKADRKVKYVPQSSLAEFFNQENFHQVLNRTLPRKLILNIINVCNANCVFCAYQYRVDPNSVMPLSLVDKVTSEYASFHPNSFVSFTPTVGDPLLDRDIFLKVDKAKENGIKRVQFYTNAILLGKRVDELLASRLDNLEISLPDFQEDIYLKVFRSSAYKQVLEGISLLLKTLKEKGLQLPVQINLRGPRQLQDILKSPDYLTHIEPFITERIFFSGTDGYDNWMGLIQQSDLPQGMPLLPDLKLTHNMPCRRLFDIQILSDGKLRLCGCRSGNTVYDDLIIGDLNEKSLLEVWNSEETLKIMKGFFTREFPKACQSCNYYEPLNDKASRSFVARE